MNPFIDAVLLALREVDGALNNTSNTTLLDSFSIGEGGDVSSGFDLLAESIFFNHLSPFGSLYSEESGWMSPQSDTIIILDPIDGSDNFSSFFPYYGVAVSREVSSKTTDAVVCNLANGDIFIRTDSEYYKTSLQNSLIKEEVKITLHPKIGLFEKAHEHPFLGEKLIQNGLKYRSPGAVALSLAYAPYVKYMLFLGTMRKFDIDAGLFLSQHLYCFYDSRYILISSSKEVFIQMRNIVEKEYF
ncbi:MAG: inositol monophosphatase [Sulfuricurvum sp.]|uniref:inositol monophosphatase family protein n=1 Tax=Sulfuricurvum sp. TaxID=2025608 RepID=UPI0026132CB0|nr:inositol monophosphatase family protein [Sulfuricurvum sp.]MDD2828948.1 inositol monophosphatase [Sulfuricurvum sp.]MDD4950047.1 inositol monophosphatase [Sulfuricurvum sp.]